MPAPFDAYFEVMDESLLAVMGEECSYYPKGGDARTITAVIEQDASLTESGQRQDSQDTIHALVMRDADHADFGGIASPQPGDAFTREGSDDRFSYSGRKREVSTSAWVLEFTRELPHEIGGRRR
jgi:hypothetical protein